jgi:D-beta-D-heptose 7-phosphate kinase/D-beta-D-heptose 1-phosphate adenosyltransferase
MSTDKIVELRKFLSMPSGNAKVVFTNGCFDILHAGHVQYLEAAKGLGDILVVGLNSDASVQRLKGKNRPVNNQSDRAIVLAALEAVDYVIIFEEDTPYNLIQALQPDILVKGGDWKEADIVGADIVKAKGGKVISLPYIAGLSTTGIISKIGSQ